jgi:hypothetical protein
MGTSDEQVEDGSPAGGVGTITRPPANRPRRTHNPRHNPRRRLRPAPPPNPGTLPPAEKRAQASGTNKIPFFLLLCGLLGGALVCALVISTTLAEGSFKITRLQQASTALARQRQLLQEQVAAAQSAQVIQARARQLGMLPVGELRFLNLKTGELQTDAGRGAVRSIHVPGYTP